MCSGALLPSGGTLTETGQQEPYPGQMMSFTLGWQSPAAVQGLGIISGEQPCTLADSKLHPGSNEGPQCLERHEQGTTLRARVGTDLLCSVL